MGRRTRKKTQPRGRMQHGTEGDADINAQKDQTWSTPDTNKDNKTGEEQTQHDAH